jgi:hypothetical protein
MKITQDQLKTYQVSREGLEWFMNRFPDGEAEYQDVLDALAEDDRPDDANWLMDYVGSDRDASNASDASIEVDAIAASRKHFFAAGRLVVAAGVAIAGQLRAGGSIQSGGNIESGGSIRAGKSIRAGGGIQAKSVLAGGKIEASGGIHAGEAVMSGFGGCRCMTPEPSPEVSQ